MIEFPGVRLVQGSDHAVSCHTRQARGSEDVAGATTAGAARSVGAERAVRPSARSRRAAVPSARPAAPISTCPCAALDSSRARGPAFATASAVSAPARDPAAVGSARDGGSVVAAAAAGAGASAITRNSARARSCHGARTPSARSRCGSGATSNSALGRPGGVARDSERCGHEKRTRSWRCRLWLHTPVLTARRLFVQTRSLPPPPAAERLMPAAVAVFHGWQRTHSGSSSSGNRRLQPPSPKLCPSLDKRRRGPLNSSP